MANRAFSQTPLIPRSSRGTGSGSNNGSKRGKGPNSNLRRNLEIARAAALWVIAAVLVIGLVYGVMHIVQRQQAISTAQENQSATYKSYSFDAGYIISDSQFFDGDAMTAKQIQRFLNKRGSKCSGEYCLSTLKVTTSKETSDSLCDGYNGGSGSVMKQNRPQLLSARLARAAE